MPPKIVKRGGAAAAARRGGRVTRSTRKALNPPPESAGEEIVKIEEPLGSDAVEAKEEIRGEEKSVEEESPVDEQTQSDFHGDAAEAERGSNADGDVSLKKEDETKDSMDEYGKDERLDLDDNETEYEPEEYGGEEFEERELEQEDAHEDDEELEEEIEAEDDGGDLAEDEIADGPEELDSEGDDEHIEDEAEHAETADVEEEEEHRDVVQERRKRKEFEIFVGGLDKDASEEDLKKVFGQVGEVMEVRLMKNSQTKKNKGFAFLRFASVEQAKRAVTELKNPMINGKQCGVTASQDSDTLFLGNISKTWTIEALREKLKHYGVDNVDDITLVEDNNHAGMNRGFAFLEFSSRSDAKDAYKRLQKKDVMFGIEKPAKVSFADSFIDPGDKIMAQVKTIFIDGLSPSWNEDRVRDLLKKYGKVEKIELARNMPSAKRKDFGFVTFDTHEAAVICAKAINNSDLGVGENKAKVRARLSRPLQRGGKGRHISRSDHRSRHGSGRVGRSSWARPPPRSLPSRSARGIGSRALPPSSKKPDGSRRRRPIAPAPARARPLPPPRSYDRRPPVPSYPKASLKREYGRRDDLPPPRSRAAVDYSSRLTPERHLSYRDDYTTRGSGYPDLPRSSSRSEMRRPFMDDLYSQRFERPPSYNEGRPRGYEPVPGSKRPYSAMDDIPPRYADADVRHSRARLEYDIGPPQYGEAYGDRFARSSLGYGSSRSTMSSQDSRYGSRQGMGYGGGSYSGGDSGGMYSSSYGGDYISRRDVGGSSYSSVYSSRGMGGSSYSGSGPGPYY
ncbi:PREDICTED: nucleolin [Tarenaya hassleriana]|uniref:nucleolin n=1 Tax=Tarenaya hassleriana TaxID=28532 RepID=UPI00053C390F|nr:PREDICTED: nucleolin [Tarenaya hassleriana]